MDADAVALLGGLLFLLLALVGGGFSIKEISMPTIPALARAACLVVGVVLVMLAFLPSMVDGPEPVTDDQPSEQAGVTTGDPGKIGEATDSASEEAGAVLLWEQPDPSLAADDGIELSGLRATASQSPPVAGDQILIEYTFVNVGTSPVTFNFTFTGVRAPGDRWADTGEANQGAVVEPGAALSISHAVLLDTAGSWMIWPCYEKRTENGSSSECPDGWNRFFVTVR